MPTSLLLSISLLLLLLPPASHTLLVTIRDETDGGVAGVVVMVRDESGMTELARAVTDSAGRVQLDSLPATIVRVAVQGTRRDGIALSQAGDDALGIWFRLDLEPVTTMNLRVERDGHVIPDPALEIAPELLDPTVQAEATRIAPPPVFLRPTALLIQGTEAITPPSAFPPQAQPRPAPRASSTIGRWLLIAALGTLGLGLAVLALRRPGGHRP